jgi:hypothetical protein
VYPSFLWSLACRRAEPGSGGGLMVVSEIADKLRR